MISTLIKVLLLLVVSTTASADLFQCEAFGRHVPQIPVTNHTLAAMGVGGGVAIHPHGRPITLYDERFENGTEEFLNSILAHECAHHLLRHTHYRSRPNDEAAADCLAVTLLQQHMGYGKKEIDIIGATVTVAEGTTTRSEKMESCRLAGDTDGRRTKVAWR